VKFDLRVCLVASKCNLFYFGVERREIQASIVSEMSLNSGPDRIVWLSAG
jgi:hypothetical protein